MYTCADLEIQAINYSAYGASLVHVGQNDEPVTPLYNYLKPYPGKLRKQFYDQYGGELVFSVLTASPILGSLNSGMQLYRIKKEKPELFAKIKYSLHLPQYLSWLFTGKFCTDITSIGCHTNLWDFSRNYYHEWVLREGIIDKLPPIHSSGMIFPVKPPTSVQPLSNMLNGRLSGIGLHDSSAAMIPYLGKFTEPFILISTGTWCISMNAFDTAALTANGCKTTVYVNMSLRACSEASRLLPVMNIAPGCRLAEYFQKSKIHFKLFPIMRLSFRFAEAGRLSGIGTFGYFVCPFSFRKA
jgi:sugar (pentulose or hexulose) kinase